MFRSVFLFLLRCGKRGTGGTGWYFHILPSSSANSLPPETNSAAGNALMMPQVRGMSTRWSESCTSYHIVPSWKLTVRTWKDAGTWDPKGKYSNNCKLAVSFGGCSWWRYLKVAPGISVQIHWLDPPPHSGSQWMNNLLASRMGRWSNSMSVVCQVILGLFLGLFLLYKETSWLRHAGLTFGRANPRTSRRDDLMVMLCPCRMFRGSVKPPPAAFRVWNAMVKNSASHPFRASVFQQVRIRFADDQTKEMGEMRLWTHGFCGSFSVGKAAIFGEDSVSLFRCPRTPNRLQDLKSEILNKRVIQSDFCGPFFKATGNSKISPLWYF